MSIILLDSGTDVLLLDRLFFMSPSSLSLSLLSAASSEALLGSPTSWLKSSFIRFESSEHSDALVIIDSSSPGVELGVKSFTRSMISGVGLGVSFLLPSFFVASSIVVTSITDRDASVTLLEVLSVLKVSLVVCRVVVGSWLALEEPASESQPI